MQQKRTQEKTRSSSKLFVPNTFKNPSILEFQLFIFSAKISKETQVSPQKGRLFGCRGKCSEGLNFPNGCFFTFASKMKILNPRMEVWKMMFLFNWLILRVSCQNFQGVSSISINPGICSNKCEL